MLRGTQSQRAMSAVNLILPTSMSTASTRCLLTPSSINFPCLCVGMYAVFPHLCMPTCEGSTSLVCTPMHKVTTSLVCESVFTAPLFVHANARGVDSSRPHRPPLCPCLSLPIHKGSCLLPLLCASVFTTSPI